MKAFLMVVTARVGNFFHLRWLFLWPETSGVRPIHMLAGGLFSLLLWSIPHFRPRLVQELSPLVVQLEAVLPATPAPETLCAPFGAERPARLKDDTSVTLNSGTCIVTTISKKVRLIQLQSGEAIFRVTRDPSRPFVVETGPLAIQVLGTEFDVYRKAVTTRVSVIEGAVKVSSRNQMSPMNAKPLKALEQMDIPDDPAQTRIRRPIKSSDFGRITAWVHGDIELQDQTLQEVFDEARRYQRIQVEFQDPAIANIRFSGLIHTNELDGLLQVLKFKCIHSDYTQAEHRITLAYEPGKYPGMVCR
jgi:ferric-dicitrate binding protein FerR (iron transport regulator)